MSDEPTGLTDNRAGEHGPSPLAGVVNLNKPLGWPSTRAVTFFRYLLAGPGKSGRRAVTIGHAGTLDPLADGVLVLLVGRATRLAETLMNAGKEYDAAVRLGATSTTDDGEGRIVPTAGSGAPGAPPTEAAVREILARFVGRIEQRPPAHSAVHVGGRRAYHIARHGPPPALAPRTVTIHRIDLLGYDLPGAPTDWPTLRLRVVCGRGVYVRSLARDIGSALGVGGYLAGLTRTRVGPFRLEQAVRPDACRAANRSDWLLPAERAVVELPRIDLTDAQAESITHGMPLQAELIGGAGDSERAPVAAFGPAGELVALCRVRGDRLCPIRVLRARSAG